ncbi:MAG: 3-oxoacyl-ACP reductase family protein [Desulfobacterales bacterium]|jgi:2-hydroxycyclohexanecarboxyl-CoA dehydrogenase|nr:3-oxoacyl-ACP reductase family protein [Desulfobacterales bacterium]
MDFGLKDKVAIVTGGAQGIGRVLARTFAQEGADVVIGDLNEAAAQKVIQEVAALGRKAVFVNSDVSKLEGTDKLAAAAVDNFGRLDIIVNVAAIFQLGKFMDTTPEEWQKVLAVDLTGAFNCAKSVLPKMIEQKSGKIIFIGTDAARVGDSFQSIYAAAKAGVLNFTKSLAQDMGPKGINVNCVCPAVTQTEENEAILDKLYGIKSNPDKAKKVLAGYPMRRLGTGEDIAAACVFLASDKATYITGQTLSVNGGFSMP